MKELIKVITTVKDQNNWLVHTNKQKEEFYSRFFTT